MPYRISLMIVGLVCTLYYAVLAPLECGAYCLTIHEKIIANEFASPWTYRILMPFLAELLIRNQIVTGVYAAYITLHLFLLPATLLIMFEWLRLFTSELLALGACMMFACFLPLIFITNYGIAAWSIAEVLLLCVSLLLLQIPLQRRRHFMLIATVTVIATLNRSSAIMIPIAYGITYFDSKKLWDKRLLIECVVLVLLCLATLASVRWTRGYSPPMVSFPNNISASLLKVPITTLVNNFLLLPFWILALVRWRYTHLTIKRYAVLIPFYTVAVVAFAIWNEIRIWLPMFPIVLAIIFTSAEASKSQQLSTTSTESGSNS